jgi:hypothetical protein
MLQAKIWQSGFTSRREHGIQINYIPTLGITHKIHAVSMLNSDTAESLVMLTQQQPDQRVAFHHCDCAALGCQGHAVSAESSARIKNPPLALGHTTGFTQLSQMSGLRPSLNVLLRQSIRMLMTRHQQAQTQFV